MWRATIKGLLAHKLRLGLTALAIVLGVAFVAGTFILTDTMGRAFDNLFATVNQGVAVEITGIPRFESNAPGGETAGSAERVPANLLDTVRQVDGVKAAEGGLSGYAQLVDKNGKAITTGGAPTLGDTWSNDPALNPLRLREGRPPTTELKGRIQSVLPTGYQAKTGEEAAQKASDDIKQALSFFNIALLVFAAIALFVGAFIIFNTFQILVTQRTRELALLRALGASPAQIRRSVVAEALIVGVLASIAGLAF